MMNYMQSTVFLSKIQLKSVFLIIYNYAWKAAFLKSAYILTICIAITYIHCIIKLVVVSYVAPVPRSVATILQLLFGENSYVYMTKS